MKHIVSMVVTGLFFLTTSHAECPYGGNKCKAGMSSWEQAEFFGPKLEKLKGNQNINNVSIQQKNSSADAIINAYGHAQSFDGGKKYGYIFQNLHNQRNANGSPMNWRQVLSNRLSGLNNQQLAELEHQIHQHAAQ